MSTSRHINNYWRYCNRCPYYSICLNSNKQHNISPSCPCLVGLNLFEWHQQPLQHTVHQTELHHTGPNQQLRSECNNTTILSRLSDWQKVVNQTVCDTWYGQLLLQTVLASSASRDIWVDHFPLTMKSLITPWIFVAFFLMLQWYNHVMHNDNITMKYDSNISTTMQCTALQNAPSKLLCH